MKVNTDHDRRSTRRLGLYFVGLLNKLGYKATLQALSPDIQYPYVAELEEQAAVRVLRAGTRTTRPPRTSSTSCSGAARSTRTRTRARTSPQFCNKAIQAKMDQAGQIGHHRPGRRRTSSGPQVDKEVTDQAPWVAMFNPKYIDFLSIARQGLPVQPAVVLPPRPGLGEVTEQERRRVAEFAFEPEPEVRLAPGESVKEISGRSPWRIAGRRLVRNRIAMAALALFLLIVVVSLLGPVLREPHRPHRPVRLEHYRDDRGRTGRRSTWSSRAAEGSASGETPDRADLAVELLPRRRQPGP